MIGPVENGPIRFDRSSGEPGRGDEKQTPAGADGPDRVAEIRQRIADGTYDTPEVLELLARRLIERGDL